MFPLKMEGLKKQDVYPPAVFDTFVSYHTVASLIIIVLTVLLKSLLHMDPKFKWLGIDPPLLSPTL